MFSTVFLICGYKGTGKDSLFQKLSRPSGAEMCRASDEHNWLVYKKPELEDLSTLISGNIKRYAFADELKKEVGLVHTDKEIARETWIRYATEKRSQDINYFCRKVYVKMLDDEGIDVFIITDFRFHNELAYLKGRFEQVYTIRVYRSQVPIPDMSIESEHQLDDLEEDYLLIDTESEYCGENNYVYSETI